MSAEEVGADDNTDELGRVVVGDGRVCWDGIWWGARGSEVVVVE